MQVLSVLALSAVALATSPAVERRAEPAALLAPGNKDILADQYIVKMKKGKDAMSVASQKKAHRTYKSEGFKGFAAKLTAAELDEVRAHPDVDYVEHDFKAKLATYTTQSGAPWGISRISQTAPGSSDYIYDDTAGSGTCVYMIDTGINVSNADFEGRAIWLENFIDDDDNDGAGHGTWTAGLVGSATYGVAKKSTMYALKVFDDSGVTSGSAIVDAMTFVASDAASRASECPTGLVANMSLGGGFSQSSNDAADAMVSAGVFVAVAAGNDGNDASQTSPCSAATVCCVGATDENDAIASFSNYGSTVDIMAPGTNLESTSYDGTSTSASGTSGSSPIVAGLAAYFMAYVGNPGASNMCSYIQEYAQADALSGLPDGTPNWLAHNGATSV